MIHLRATRTSRKLKTTYVLSLAVEGHGQLLQPGSCNILDLLKMNKQPEYCAANRAGKELGTSAISRAGVDQ